jgi:hypothetical protein
MQLIPNFLIVGAPKSGTTSLHEYLRQHPEVFVPNKHKEPTYFVREGKGSWNSFGGTLDSYIGLFRNAKGKRAVGEASTAYLYDQESPSWIKEVLSEVKIIILLRNPAKRAFSLYTYNTMHGWEDAPTFEEALRREPLRLQDAKFRAHCPHLLQAYLYFDTGLYFEQVKRYLDTFGRKRVKVYLFEDLVRRPHKICNDTFRFLDVDPAFVPAIDVYNESRSPRSIALQFWLETKAESVLRRYANRYAETLAKPIPRFKEINKSFGNKPRLAKKLYDHLMDRYLPDIYRLEGLLGRDLSLWYGSRTYAAAKNPELSAGG